METENRKPEGGNIALDLVMVTLAVASIVMLVYDEFAQPTGEIRAALITLDWFVVAIFAVEFLFRLRRAPDRRAFLRRNWYEIPGMVPMAAGEAGFLRIFRVLRILRVFRLFRAVTIGTRLRRLNTGFDQFLRRSRIAQTMIVALLLVLLCSFVVWMLERETNANFESYSEALWWAVVTVTTVGYGDITPITPEGRSVAVVMMLTGIGLIGTLAATLSNVMLKTGTEPAVAPTGLVENLERLVAMRSAGNLTEEEFLKAKGHLLGAVA